MRAVAIRKSHKIGTRSKLTCISTPMTGVTNRGAVIVYDNGFSRQRGLISNFDDRKVNFCVAQVAYRDRVLSIRQLCGLKPWFIVTGRVVVTHPGHRSIINLHSRLVSHNIDTDECN